ncbi:hypothetical protein J4476_02710 [Candidatus Woesearchaeota archaeon]|nr:MAG: hypothetical protein QT09_C0002G0002 [archaeon GW2011_AR18]MBS3161581.1 hypothetical protein [Candidatus Woesearchaeota archaeon]HIH26126.1 hypothetical protein [Nanoarchaeota archaeon]
MNKLPWETKNREILVKKQSVTDEKYGKKPEDRTAQELLNSGVISLNKSDGPTSHQVADYAKKILESDKVGHGGTLEI